MKASLAWLNRLLDRPVTADEAEHALTFAGFPIESREVTPAGDTILDVEITSNRGDVVCHAGVARELAAATGRTFKPPAIPEASATEGSGPCPVQIENADHGACPLFTATVIRGVKIGPSPAWLRAALEAIGQRSISNVVDITNYVLHELGQPSHVFDLGALQGKSLSIRSAAKGEKLAMLDGQARALQPGEFVIADASGPVSLAGIMGGQPTSVTDRTTDIVLEVATWRPAMVRNGARRLGIRTDSSNRYERWVPPATMEAARRRLTGLILETAGGRIDGGVARIGAAIEPTRPIMLRAARLRAVLGTDTDDATIDRSLRAHGLNTTQRPTPAGTVFEAVAPPHRPDVRIEEDLIEEVARTIGYENIPVIQRLPVRISAPQESERAERRIAEVLAGLGFFETVTFSFTSPARARPWLAAGIEALTLPDDRRGGEPTLRPSLLTGLLAARKSNQDARARQEGGVRLFEVASVYGQKHGSGASAEARRVALVLDVALVGGKEAERRQHALRVVRGAVEAVVAAMGGAGSGLRVEPADAPQPGWESGACASVEAGGKRLGVLGLVSGEALRQFDLSQAVAAAELDLDGLMALYPPRALAHELPRFPPVEKDLTIVVPEAVRWSAVAALVEQSRQTLAHLESCQFVGVFRDAARAGSKNVTFRLTFRDHARTLTNEEVDAAVESFKKTGVPTVGKTLEEALAKK